MARFLLLRHGETAWDLPRGKGTKGWGIEIAPLTEKGIRQIQAIVPDIRDWAPELFLSSPATRTLESCALICSELKMPFKVAFDLHEWIPDQTQMWTSIDEVRTAYEEMERCGGEWPEGETRGWEPLSQVRHRTLGVLEQYRKRSRVAVLCHEVVIKSLTGHNLGLAESIAYEISA